MAGIKSINELKPPLNPDVNVPKIATQAVGEPPKPTTTYYTPEKIISVTFFEGRFYVATENGVYYLNDLRNCFRRLKFEIVEEENE